MNGKSHTESGRDLGLLLALANTGHTATDELATSESVRDWWLDIRPDAARGKLDLGSEADLDALRSARAVIRALTLRHNGVDVDADASGLGAIPLTFEVNGKPDLTVHGHSNLLKDIAGQVVVELLRASSSSSWHRVKACPGADCAWVFLDRSRNGSRRWCQMNECGNRAKGAAFRARNRTTS